MQILPVRDDNGHVVEWKGINYEDGYVLNIRETADNTGVICNVVDSFTGHNIVQLIGSSVKSVSEEALKRMNKFANSPVSTFI